MRQYYILICFFALLGSLSAQQTSALWTQIALDAVSLPDDVTYDFEPKEYRAYTLDFDAMRKQLALAPMEFTAEAKQAPLVLELPMSDGTMERFALQESPVMAPGLQARYPNIRTFSGYSLDTPNKLIRCGHSPEWGFRAIVLRPDKEVDYIEPLARWQTRYYRVYDRKDFPNELRPEVAGEIEFPKEVNSKNHDDLPTVTDPQVQQRGTELNDPVVLKEYRFAAACTGEFAQQNGGTTQAVLAKIVDVTNKLNAIYERDLDIRLELVENNDKIVFLDPATDPYTGTTVGGWLNQNPLAMVQNLGSADQYDIGHVFARYLGGGAIGVGSLGSCCTQLKGRGCSAGYPPYEDDFFAIIGQEIGHQWDALHTWNHCGGTTEPFGDGERCEPGSGTTIMSYSGGCGFDNIRPGNADLYYNICSIVSIRSFVEIGVGATCGTNITTDNHPPVVEIPYPNNFFIPISTPFELTGSATDPDDDPVDYCWEQIDTGPLVVLGNPVGSSPIFRSYPPVSSPTRVFPRIQTVLSNQTDITELLPTYSRDMTFALTARDNRSGGGGVGIDTVRFKATDLAGPFLVTYPSGSFASWKQGEHQVVTWDVANTDQAPVNCQKVNITLSLNGGISYPIVLASNVANTGRYCVEVPDVATPIARIRVEAADNVFFDVSNSNFTIESASAPGFTFCPSALFDTICLPETFTSVISTTALAGFSDPINFSADDLPAGVTATISPNPVVPGTDAVLTLDLPANQTETTFDFTLIADAGGVTDSLTNTVSVYFNDFTGLSLKAPADGSAGLDRAPVLSWNAVANANFYEIEVATSPAFGAGTVVTTRDNIQADSFKVPILLEKGSVYYWRFRPKNECGSGAWVGPFVFSTLVDVCAMFESNDVPKNITGSLAITVESTINVPAGGKISDVNIPKVQGYHEFFKDLEMHLVSPSGKEVLLFKDKCPNFNGSFNFGFDESKPGLFGCPPPNNGSTYKPVESLNEFNGDDAGGPWTLRVKDNVISSGGALQAFELELCSSTALNPPILVNNNALQVAPGSNKTIPTDLLKTEDANNSDDELVYTLMSLPEHGHLELFWTGAMQVGDQFTQTDLNNNGLRYFDYGGIAGSDQFCFSVTDGEGGLVKDCFTIQQFPLSAKDKFRTLEFGLAPNPATETVRLTFGEALQSDTRVRILDAAGRLMLNQVVGAGQVVAQLTLTQLPEGLYVVVVENAEQSGVRKLMVR